MLSLIVLLGGFACAAELSGQEILDDLGFSTILSGSGVAELNLITENARGPAEKILGQSLSKK